MSPSPKHELHGREEALASLRAALGGALGANGAIASVSGEAGIGKTALASAIAAEAEARGATVTWGRAWEFADAPPYFPLWPCLRTLGIDAALVSDPGRDGAGAFRLWEDVLRALAGASATAPVVWILEDLHAADLGTLDLLTFLAQPLRAMRVFVVATVRTPDARITERMMQRLTRIARDGIDVRLDGLTPSAVATLTAETLGRAVPERELAKLVELTGGNPLFVVECARAFRAAGGVEGTLGTLPPTIRQVVLDRLATLPASTREMLAAGAVLGRELSAATVARMKGTLPAAVIDALLPALRSGLVTETAPGRYLFTHALVRDAIDEARSPAERAELHALAESALAPLGDTAEVLVERARHALAALRQGGQDRALDLARRALALLERDGAFDRAFELLVRIDEARVAGFLPSATADEKLHHATVARTAGRSDASRRLCEDVIAVARAASDASALARAVLLLAADVRPGTIDRTQVALLEEARDALGEEHPALRCRVLARLAAALQPARDPSVPIRITRAAIAGARACADEGALLDVLELAVWGLYTAPLVERVAVVEELRERALANDDLAKAVAGGVMLAFYRVEAGDLGAFDTTVDELLALSETLGHPRHRWRVLLLASMRAVACGHFGESDRWVTEVTQLAPLVDEPALPWTLGLHEIFRMRCMRRDDEARSRMVGIADHVRGDVDGHVFAGILRATTGARIEDAAETRAGIAAVGSAVASILPDRVPTALFAEAVAFAGGDDLRRQLRDVLRAPGPRDMCGEVMSFTYEGPLARILGLLDASLGERETAETALREAIATAKARKHAPWVAQISYELAKLRPRDADELLATAGTLARELGMVGLERSIASSSEIAPARVPTSERIAITKQGADWIITHGDRIVRTKDSRGIQLLARLVERPGEEIHVLALASDEASASVVESSAGEMLDETAKRAYRARAADLEREIAEAETNADVGRLPKLRAEREALLAELGRAVGLGRRDRRAGSATERARVNVQRRVKDAIARIAEADAALGLVFERRTSTGTFCCFSAR